MTEGDKAKLSEQDFVVQAIEKLRTEGRKGIHVVYSGFNEAFRTYFDDADPREKTAQLEKDGVVSVRPCRGGAMLYLAADAPPAVVKGAKALAQMGV